jgi:dTDP-4-dehydrorhamnose reductase
MTILVTGSNGQLGNQMRLLGATSDNIYIYTDVTTPEGVETTYLDITRYDDVLQLMQTNHVEVVVNCAAYTNVDKAEDDFATADLINHTAAENLARACATCGAALIHVSTDYVFGGNGCLPCTEDQPTAPLGVYGRTKLAGELAIQASGCTYVILRTAWLYSAYGNNFVKTMRRLTAERDRLNVVFDQVGTPTYAGDLAEVIFKIVEEQSYAEHPGIYHFSNEGVCSWYDFTIEIRDLSGNTCDVQPCHSNEFPSKVERPHFSVLDKTKIKQTFGITVPYWKDSLRRCIAVLEA